MRTLRTASLLWVSAFSLASLASLGGCAVATDHAGDESPEAAADSVSKFGRAFVATWSRSAAGSTDVFFDTLTLASDATYTAETSPTCAPGTFCPMHIVLEKGRWRVSPKGVLTLTSDLGDRKTFDAAVSTDGWELKIGDAAGIEHFRRLARAGEHCGGFVAVPNACLGGLVCFLGHVPDAGGTCEVPANDGESCGFREQTLPCVAGDECKHVSGPLDALTCAPATTTSCPAGQHLCAAHRTASGTCQPAYCLFAGAMCVSGPSC